MSTKSSRLLLIFLKEPIPGKVKTRLAKKMGETKAVQAYEALVSTLITQLKWIPNCHYRFCYAPSDADFAILNWILPQLDHRVELSADGNSIVTPLSEDASTVDFQPQSEGDLGDRLETAFQRGFNDGYNQVAAIGTDCPYVSARWIDTAFNSGKNSDVTIGPTFDGGYYFIALNQFTTAPFRDIPWSEETTYSATIEALDKEGLKTYALPKFADIDHEEDWDEALKSPLGGKLKKALEAITGGVHPT